MPTDSRVLAPISHAISLPQSEALVRARTLATRVQERGGRALLVGGFVRDALLGLNPKDADIEVYGLEAEELRRVLAKMGRVNCVGESFRVYKLAWHDEENTRHELDVSLPRRDRKVGEGHRGFEVTGDPHASFEDACRRRDFTINAMLCDPLSGEIIDPFDGRADLGKRVLRAVDSAHFAEDSLRVLRAAQFAARFGLMIAPETVELCRSIDLSDLPRERIFGEWEKLLLKASRPSLGLLAAKELRVLAQLFPYVEGAVRRKGYLGTLDGAAREKDDLSQERQLTLMLAAQLFSLEESARETLLDTLGIWTQNGYDVRAQTLSLAHDAENIAAFFARRNEVPDGELRRQSLRCEPILLMKLARAQGENEAANWFEMRMRALSVFDKPPLPLLQGRHLLELGLKPGPLIGEITRAVYERQLDGDVRVLADALEVAKEML
jgi:tRNA nucleotidyltransferase (CCA-adding enzyme)